MTWDWVKQNGLTVVNLLGSVASITGFAILILSMASADSNRPPEVIVWQYVFFFVCLIFISASAVFTVFWIADGLATSSHATRTANIVVVTLKLTIGLLLIGIGLDGLVSSIHWTIWLALPLHALRLL
jgi:hypothetical protein